MAEAAVELIQCKLVQCIKCLLSFYSSLCEEQILVTALDKPDICEETLVCSTIGLIGDQFKLSVVILATSETIARFCPIKGASTTDWIGELANQLGGRLKNALIEFGNQGQLSLPVTLSGSSIRLWGETDAPVNFRVVTDLGEMIFRLEVEVEPGSVWELSQEPAVAAEGSMCLF